MPGPGPGPGIFFQKKNKKINQPSNGGGPGPWGPIYIINIIIKFMIFHMIFNGILTCFKRIFNPF